MIAISSIIGILQKPFPDIESWASYLKYSTALSVFVTFFLYIFQPFGLSTLESNTFWICLGFGGMTFAGAIIYELTIGQILKATGLKTNWTLGKWILNNLGTMLFISLANFIFARLIIIGFIDWSLLPTMIYSTFMIGILPITALGGFMVLKGEKKYQQIAQEINKRTVADVNNDPNEAQIFQIPINRIKYIEALQNYVKIGHVTSEGEFKIQTERSTLKEIEQAIRNSPIIKCHRSFLVNKEAINSASGNAQGLLLTLVECDKTIPVSRACVPYFR
ncbi:MAG: LytTR family DNA-binding domain-containing protein [Cyclobacteriaceae bacterium]